LHAAAGPGGAAAGGAAAGWRLLTPHHLDEVPEKAFPGVRKRAARARAPSLNAGLRQVNGRSTTPTNRLPDPAVLFVRGFCCTERPGVTWSVSPDQPGPQARGAGSEDKPHCWRTMQF
jgi:hypothetical protein